MVGIYVSQVPALKTASDTFPFPLKPASILVSTFYLGDSEEDVHKVNDVAHYDCDHYPVIASLGQDPVGSMSRGVGRFDQISVMQSRGIRMPTRIPIVN